MASSNGFHQIADNIRPAAKALVHTYQAYALDASMQLAPVKDGDLRDSGTLAPGDDEYSARIAFTEQHALPQEFGTEVMQAQPFVRPAFEALNRPFKGDLRKVLKP